jgi:hypothetical protein
MSLPAVNCFAPSPWLQMSSHPWLRLTTNYRQILYCCVTCTLPQKTFIGHSLLAPLLWFQPSRHNILNTKSFQYLISLPVYVWLLCDHNQFLIVQKYVCVNCLFITMTFLMHFQKSYTSATVLLLGNCLEHEATTMQHYGGK